MSSRKRSRVVDINRVNVSSAISGRTRLQARTKRAENSVKKQKADVSPEDVPVEKPVSSSVSDSAVSDAHDTPSQVNGPNDSQHCILIGSVNESNSEKKPENDNMRPPLVQGSAQCFHTYCGPTCPSRVPDNVADAETKSIHPSLELPDISEGKTACPKLPKLTDVKAKYEELGYLGNYQQVVRSAREHENVNVRLFLHNLQLELGFTCDYLKWIGDDIGTLEEHAKLIRALLSKNRQLTLRDVANLLSTDAKLLLKMPRPKPRMLSKTDQYKQSFGILLLLVISLLFLSYFTRLWAGF